MFDYPYLVELLSPKRSAEDQIEGFLDEFAERYRRVINAGCGISIPDNPMGRPRLGALESINLRGLSVDPEKTVMNLNTFHTKKELDGLLQKAVKADLKYILVVRGDGGPLLSKLDPKSIGCKSCSVSRFCITPVISIQIFPGPRSTRRPWGRLCRTSVSPNWIVTIRSRRGLGTCRVR